MITANRMLEILKERDIVVRRHPSGGGWLAETSKGTRLGGKRREPFASPEDAIEAAERSYIETELRNAEAGAARLFDVLGTGAFYPKPRTTTTTIDGITASFQVWDIFRVNNEQQVVAGEPSLRAAVLAAEAVIRKGPK